MATVKSKELLALEKQIEELEKQRASLDAEYNNVSREHSVLSAELDCMHEMLTQHGVSECRKDQYSPRASLATRMTSWLMGLARMKVNAQTEVK